MQDPDLQSDVVREEKATSKPAFRPGIPWKQVTIFPPKPKVTTGARADVLDNGSLAPMRDGEGAYCPVVTFTVSSWEPSFVSGH